MHRKDIKPTCSHSFSLSGSLNSYRVSLFVLECQFLILLQRYGSARCFLCSPTKNKLMNKVAELPEDEKPWKQGCSLMYVVYVI